MSAPLLALALALVSDPVGTTVRTLSLTDYPGRALRERLHHPLPQARELIIIHATAGHSAIAEGSIVAWADQAGTWKVETISEVKILAPPPPGSSGPQAAVEQPRIERTLTADETRRLRALLTNAALYEPPKKAPGGLAPQLGASEHEMEIISSFGRRRFGWDSRREGLSGAVADLILR